MTTDDDERDDETGGRQKAEGIVKEAAETVVEKVKEDVKKAD